MLAFLLGEVPEDFFRKTVQIIVDGTRTEYQRCSSQREFAEARDLFPHARRAWIEQHWRDLGQQYEGASARAVPNSSGHSHTEIRFGRVVLTESAIPSGTQVPQRAVFRDTLAAAVQMDLFEQPVDPPVNAALYALVVYGPRDSYAPTPGFVRVVAPLQDGTIVTLMDLTPVLMRLLAPLPAVPVETIADEVAIALRPDAGVPAAEPADSRTFALITGEDDGQFEDVEPPPDLEEVEPAPRVALRPGVRPAGASDGEGE